MTDHDDAGRSPGAGCRGRRSRPLVGRRSTPGLLVTLLALAASVAPARAQQPGSPDTLTVAGVVVDASTGAPVAGAFLSLGERGPRTLSAPDGTFTLRNVAAGTERLLVERFGYRALELALTVPTSPEPLVLRMEPDPLVIEGVTVTGGARVAVSGVVRDAVSGEALPWTDLWLSRDAVRREGRTSADAQGVFRIPDVETGGYFLRVERLGYESQFVLLGVGAPPEPVEVRLQPDSALLAGLAVMDTHMDSRRRSAPGPVQSFDEARLRTSVARGMRSFLEADAMLPMFPCGDREMAFDCRDLRGSLVRPRVYIDELNVDPMSHGYGVDQLGSYAPRDFYRVDVFVCTAGDRLGGWEIRAYTYEYMERMGGRPRSLIRHCL